ncbi:hypothetical protein J3R08_000092 [Micromonospora sp. HB375]|nr:hypothetical protein [Micromonospora sp. HB375]
MPHRERRAGLPAGDEQVVEAVPDRGEARVHAATVGGRVRDERGNSGPVRWPVSRRYGMLAEWRSRNRLT